MIDIIKDSVEFYRNHFRLIFSVFFPVYILELLINNIFKYAILHFGSNFFIQSLYILMMVIVYSIYTTSLIILFGGIINGNHVPPLECIKRGIFYIPIFLLTEIIVTFFTVAGLILLIVPGIIIGAKLSLSQFYLILSDDMPIDAVKNSYKSTNGITSAIIYTVFMISIPIFILKFIIEIILSDVIFAGPVVSTIIDFIFECITLIFPIIIFRFFCIAQQAGLKDKPA